MSLKAFLDASAGSRRHAVDARRNRPRIGRIIMVYGRHATDCTTATTLVPVAPAGFTWRVGEVIHDA